MQFERGLRRQWLRCNTTRLNLPAGYLEKQQRKGTKAWQSRWFELDGVQLRYYKSAKDVEQGTPALGMVWVQDLLSVRVLQG
eukprot:SAG25_NODE_8290_length_429_cov_1.409091_1_plen_81_part_01